MKEKNYIYSVESDVNSIELNLKNANVEICEAADEKFYMEYPNAKNIYAANDESGIILHQGKSGLFSKPQQNIKIYVPAHTVPSVKIYGKNVDVHIDGGIFGELTLSVEDGSANLSDCVFDSAEISGGDFNMHVAGATIKSGLIFQSDKGDVLAENTFLNRAEVRVKRGNIGVVNVSCKDCAFDTQKGNITASLAGNEENFNTSLITHEGTLNRESCANEGADGNFHAYTKRGNIVLDFIDEPTFTPDFTSTEVYEEYEEEHA